MKIQNGDIVYSSKGKPGLAIGREELSNKLIVENQGEGYEKARKYGFINGMKPSERADFVKIIDKVKAMEDPKDRVSEIVSQIKELSADPKNMQLVRYLEAEQAHIMFNEGISPRTYSIDEMKVTA